MSSKENSKNNQELSEDSENKNTLSIDEFFRQLEAKEKDLDISSELVIEIEDEADTSDTGEVPELLKQDVFAPAREAFAATVASDLSPNLEEFSGLENKLSNLQNQLLRLEAERTEMYELTRRRHTDFESYKKRTERERSETFRNQLSNLATQMLPVLDNLNRALDSVSLYPNERRQDFQQFFEGIMLVSQQLGEVLEEMGVQPIIAVGEAFDPYFHEAVATEHTDDVLPNTIVEELLRGYRIDDKIIRPSMVKVSSPTKLTSSDAASPATE